MKLKYLSPYSFGIYILYIINCMFFGLTWFSVLILKFQKPRKTLFADLMSTGYDGGRIPHLVTKLWFNKYLDTEFNTQFNQKLD